MCPWCGSIERHRLIWLFFQRNTDLFDGCSKWFLHFAPEPAFVRALSEFLGGGYITADLQNDSMLRLDMTRIPFPAASLDVIYASHVLEYIVDDTTAIRELARVIKPEGWALIVVPVSGEKTFEDNSVVEPADRARVFGQWDHVRICGSDYAARLENNGFHVKTLGMAQVISEAEQEKFGITDRTLYYCTRNGEPLSS